MITVIELASIEEAFSTLRLTNARLFGETLHSEWIFRGQPSRDHRLLPAVWRDDFLAKHITASGIFHEICEQAGKTGWGNHERDKRGITAVKRLAIEYLHLKNMADILTDVGLRSWGGTPDLEKRLDNRAELLFDEPWTGELTIAQHYGIPTRLLDWTLDPLTALSFAVDGFGDAKVAVWAFNYRQYMASTATGEPYRSRLVSVVHGDATDNEYLKAQRGLFTFIYHGDKIFIDTGSYPAVEDIVPAPFLIRFEMDVSTSSRIFLLKGLLRERRTAAHLMPDHGNAAKLAKRLFSAGLGI